MWPGHNRDIHPTSVPGGVPSAGLRVAKSHDRSGVGPLGPSTTPTSHVGIKERSERSSTKGSETTWSWLWKDSADALEELALALKTSLRVFILN